MIDNKVLGKKQSRDSWTTTEKETKTNYVNDRIYENHDVSRQNVWRIF